MKKFLLPFAIGGAVALAVQFFNGQEQTPAQPQTSAEATPPTAQEKQEIPLVTMVAPWEINSLSPTQSGVIFQRMNLAETLVEANLQGELTAGLAKEWQSNETATVWTFTLRDATFHNGKPLTAQAVANSLNIALAQPGILQKAFVKTIKAVGQNQVEIELTKAFVPFPSFLTHYTTIILAEESYNEKGEVVQIIGTGAYKPTKIEAPQKVEATRFEQYWGEKPSVKEAKYLASSRSETRMLMAQSDATSVVFNLDTPSIERLKNDPNLTINSESIARTIQLKLNVGNPLFNDLAVRKALSQAIDRTGIANSVLKIDQGAADQILPRSFSEWRIDSEVVKPDYAKIRQDLIDAGYQFNAEGQLLDKSGKPFTFTMRTYPDRPELPIIATILQAQWKMLGVDVKVAIGNFSEIPLAHQNGSLEVALYAYNYGKTLDPFGVIVQDFAKNGGDWGVMNWQNPTLDQALVDLETERDPAKNRALKQTVSQIIHDELPIIPVVYYQQNAVSHKEIKGVTLDPFERRFFLEKLSK